VKKKVDWQSLRGDISGASVTAVITIPLVVAYGLIAFAPLGSGFASRAAFIGLLSAFFTCFAASLLGSTPILITTPTAALTLMMSSIVGYLAASPLLLDIPSRETVILGLMSLSVLTAAMVQFLFSAFRLGNLVKYVPYPVMAGFMNGIAVLLILKQIRPFLGVDPKTPLLQIVLRPQAIEPLTFLVGLFTLAAIFFSARWFRRIPGLFVGLISGTTLYYGIFFLFDPTRIGSTIGQIDFRITGPLVSRGIFHQIGGLDLASLIPTLFFAGILVGLVGSMETLFTAVMADDLTGSLHNNNRELLAQGIGNTVSGFFGCLPGAGSIPETLANYHAGGQTRFSSVFTSFLIILLTGLFAPFIGLIPLAVFAGLVLAIGFEMVDRWSVHLLRQLPKTTRLRRNILGNLAVALVVTIIMVSINLIVAVGIGIIIASTLFISKMGKSVIRREYLGNQLRSKKIRNQEHSEILERLSRNIVVFELQGPIFFGSGDHLVKKILESMKDARYCILDMKRVNEIDSTGAKSIGRACRTLRRENKDLFLSYLYEEGSLREFLTLMGFEKELGADHIFPDTDAALEKAENELLQSEVLLCPSSELDLCRLDIFQVLPPDEIQSLADCLVRREYQRGETVISNLELTRDLFFMTQGSVSIRIPLREGNHKKRLATYPAGTVFGEMAFLDGEPRSAEVICDEKSVIYVLPFEKFESLSKEKPELGLKLIRKVAIELCRRLRTTSLETAFLEEH